MKTFTKTLVREVRLPRLDPSFNESRWVLRIGPTGITVRRYGASKETARMVSWRSLIGIALIGAPMMGSMFSVPKGK